MLYRPTKFADYIGQTHLIQNLKLYIEAAKQLEKPLDHLLIYGNSGMGKTALANLIATVMEVKLHLLNGTSLQKPSDIISVLTNLKANEIIFIDEVHAVSRDVLELLYPAIEDGKINIIFGKEYNAKNLNIKLPPFTLIVATTEVNELPLPFYNRFSIIFKLESYSQTEIGQIIYNLANFLNLPLTIESANYLASFTRNNPRNATNITRRVYDFYLTKTISKLNSQAGIKKVMNQLGLYENGLTFDDFQYLSLLEKNKVLGLENLSYLLNIPIKILRQMIEPLLIKENYILRTNKGRIITQKGLEILAKIKSE